MKRLICCIGGNVDDDSSSNDNVKNFCCLNFGRKRTVSKRELLRDAYARLVASPEHARLISELTKFENEKSSLPTFVKDWLSGDMTPQALDDSDTESRLRADSAWDDVGGSVTASTISARDDHVRPNDGSQCFDNNALANGFHTIMTLNAIGTMCATNYSGNTLGHKSERHYRLHEDGHDHHIKAVRVERRNPATLIAKNALKAGVLGGAIEKVGKSRSRSTMSMPCGSATSMRQRSRAISVARNFRRSGR